MVCYLPRAYCFARISWYILTLFVLKNWLICAITYQLVHTHAFCAEELVDLCDPTELCCALHVRQRMITES